MSSIKRSHARWRSPALVDVRPARVRRAKARPLPRPMVSVRQLHLSRRAGPQLEKSTPVARRVRKARGLSQTAQLPGKFCEI